MNTLPPAEPPRNPDEDGPENDHRPGAPTGPPPHEHPPTFHSNDPLVGHQSAVPPIPPFDPPIYDGHTPPTPAKSQNSYGTTALTCGILGFILGWVPILNWFTWPLNVVAIIFGAIGWDKANKGLATNKGIAIAGLILGIIAFFGLCAISSWAMWNGGAHSPGY